MKIFSAVIEIRPRGVTELVDLAFLFYRARLPVLAGVLLAMGAPLIGAAVGLHYATGQAWPAVLFFWLTAHLATNAVTLAASRFVFGTPLTVRSALAMYRQLWAGVFFRMLGQKIVALVLLPVVVGYSLALRWTFTPMVVMLERLEGRALAVRRRGLSRRGASGVFALDVISKLILALVLVGVMLLADLIATDVLSLWGDEGLLSMSVLDRPQMLAVWLLGVLLVSPVATLGRFFLYLDARIRGEGWDLELGLRATAARIDAGKEAA